VIRGAFVEEFADVLMFLTDALNWAYSVINKK